MPDYFKGVKKVINAVSVIVGPKEGDTPDRAKYSQVCLLLLFKKFIWRINENSYPYFNQIIVPFTFITF